MKSDQEYSTSIFNGSLDMVITVDKDYHIIVFNIAAQKSFGYTKDEISGKHIKILYANEEEEKKIYETVKVKEKFIGKVTNVRKNGEIFRTLHSASIIYNQQGAVSGIVVYLREITEQNKIENELRESEERYRNVVEDMPALICRFLPEGTLTFVNNAYCQYFNKKREQLVGHNFFHFIPENEHAMIWDNINSLTQENPSLSYEHKVISPDGTIRFQRCNDRVLCDQKGNSIEYQSIGLDITDQKQIEQERIKASKLESVGIIAGGIAHDFNNILAAILGNLYLIKLSIEGEGEVNELLSEAEKAGLHARDLTHKLLTLSKGEAPIKKTSSISEIIKDSAEICLRGSNVKCKFAIASDLWSVEVDKVQINQALHNLIINAKQAMQEGGTITVNAENVFGESEDNLQLKKGKYIKISIQDTGIGIPDDHLPKIFDPYFTTKQHGSGLGLTTTYSIIMKHDGHINVVSELGVGTTFQIYLPVSLKKLQKIAIVEKETKITQGKILVMDDDEMVRTINKRILSHIGNEVMVACNGDEAVDLYKKAKEAGKPFDVVILDLTVPGGMGGKETIKELLTIDPNVKAIISSGYYNDPLVLQFKKYGFKGIISKPYRLEKLQQVLNAVMSEKSD